MLVVRICEQIARRDLRRVSDRSSANDDEVAGFALAAIHPMKIGARSE